MSYTDELQDPLWKAKRHWIIRRDNYQCRKCSKSANEDVFKANTILRGGERIVIPEETILILEDKLELNVHHKYYIWGKKPWEYEDNALITLCPECHKQEHETTSIPIYDSRKTNLKNIGTCGRCSGFGYIPQYYHVQSGICFRCWGKE